MKKPMRSLKSPINVLMIILVVAMFVGSIPAFAGSAASSAIMQFEKGMISEAELDQKLRDIGYSEDDIRQVKALSSGMKVQKEQTPESQPIIQKEINENSEIENTKVSNPNTDNIILVMGIAGVATTVAIIVAIAKHPV